MLNRKEIAPIIVVSIILAFVISFVESLEIFLYALLGIFLVILINVIAKKFMAYYVDSKIEMKFWEIKQFGFRPWTNFKKPFPAGLAFPIIVGAFTFGIITWMACLVFDVKPKTSRAAKKHAWWSFSEMTEWHIGLIAAAGIVANLIFAVVGYLLGYPNFVKYNIYFAFFNLLPLSDLDGNKIFFGSLLMWALLVVVALIGLGYAVFLV